MKLTREMTLLALAGCAAALAARSMPKRGVRGRVVLITGGSRGLGLALAREFARRGARIALCARDPGELQKAAADAGRIGETAAFPCDTTQPEQVAAMIKSVQTALGDIDVLVNNAGAITIGPAETMTRDDFHQAMDVNFFSAVNTITEVLPAMIKRRDGQIINIASVGGKMPVPHLLPYCASKFALVGLSSGLHAEVKRHGVSVVTVNPGLMRTGSPRHASVKGRHKAEYAWFTLSDSIPGLTMSAESAARRIVRAAAAERSEITLGLPAKLGAAIYGLSPGAHLKVAAAAAALLPGSPGASQAKPGSQSESPLTRSVLASLNKRAERRLNQI